MALFARSFVVAACATFAAAVPAQITVETGSGCQGFIPSAIQPGPATVGSTLMLAVPAQPNCDPGFGAAIHIGDRNTGVPIVVPPPLGCVACDLDCLPWTAIPAPVTRFGQPLQTVPLTIPPSSALVGRQFCLQPACKFEFVPCIHLGENANVTLQPC